MRALVGLAIAAVAIAAVALAGVARAEPAPAQAAALWDAADYAEALDAPVAGFPSDLDTLLNQSPAAIRAALDKARADIAAETARIEALPAPAVRATGVDLAALVASVRDAARERQRSRSAALAEAEAVVAAIDAQDAAAAQAHERAYARAEGRAHFGPFLTQRTALRTLARAFAPSARVQTIAAPPPPMSAEAQRARMHERGVTRLAATVAKALRIPAPTAASFDVVATVGTDGRVTFELPGAPPAVRAEILPRLAGVVIGPDVRLAGLTGQPVRLRYAERHIVAVTN